MHAATSQWLSAQEQVSELGCGGPSCSLDLQVPQNCFEHVLGESLHPHRLSTPPTHQRLILLRNRDTTDQQAACSGFTPIWGDQVCMHT